ncbi:MAG: glycosyl hydrolase, partial [Balneolaceae bacterium]|nr:glycosyl hydrolase [Balneolaceae bacterium]
MPKLFHFSPVILLSLFILLSIPEFSEAQSGSDDNIVIDTTLFHDMEFRTVGPTRGGRVTAVEGHRAHPHKFYMGAAGGSGVWKTEDYGQSWINLSDGHGFLSTSIGAIEVADSDTSIIYVGTGTDGIRANVTTGKGMYKSTDAGKSWKFLGLKEAGQIGAVEVHPENPDRVYVAALGHPFGPNPQRGVFRSTDGGENWENVLFASDTTGAIDLELNPENPDEIYAALWRAERKPWTIISGAATENGLYKSTDGGDTWKKLSE